MTNKIQNLRNKIAARTKELNIVFESRPDGHWYGFSRPEFESVTKKLGLIKDEGLMNWKMNRALEYVETHRIEQLDAVLRDAKLAPQQEFEGAGDIGKTVHKWREEWFRHWIETNIDTAFKVPDSRPEVIASCKAIENCILTLKAEPLACELRLADEKLRLGGTLDDLWAVPHEELVNPTFQEGDPEALRGGKKIKRTWEIWLVDLKTSNIGNKDSYYMQVALYWKMFKRLYKIKINKVFILHTSKTRFGEYELIPVKHPRRYYQMAKTAVKLYDDLQELRELKKPEVARI